MKNENTSVKVAQLLQKNVDEKSSTTICKGCGIMAVDKASVVAKI